MRSHISEYTQVDRQDIKLSWAVVMFFLAQAANLAIKTSIPISDDMWGIVSAIFGVLIIIFFARAAKSVLQRSARLVRNSYLFFAIVYISSYVLIMLRGEPTSVLESPYLLNIFVFWLPTGLCAASVINKKILYDTFIKSSFIFFLLSLLCFFGGKVGAENDYSYNMQLGFTMIIPSLFHLNEVFKGKVIFLLLFIVEVGVLLIYANRGVLLSIVFFITYKILFERKNITLLLVAIILSGVFIVYSKEIVFSLIDVLDRFNLSSRTLMRFMDNTLTESSGREEIWAVCKDLFWVHPITGWGLGGECYPIFKGLRAAGDFGHGFSPHNGILQLMLQFGAFFGTLASIYFVLPIFNMHLIKEENRNSLMLIFCSAVIIPCCFSAGDIFLKPAVAVYIYCYYYDIVKRKRQAYENH